MATTFTQFEVSPEVREGRTGLLTISFTTPVVGFEARDILSTGITLSNFTRSADGKTYTMTAVPQPDYQGVVSIRIIAGSYFNGTNLSLGTGSLLEFVVVPPVIPAAPEVIVQSTGSDGIYNIAEVGPDGTVSVTILPKENTRVGDTIRVNGTDYDVTDTVLASGLVLQVAPGAALTVTTVTAKNQFSERVYLTVPAADLEAPVASVVVNPITADNVIDSAEYGQVIVITGRIEGEYTAGDTVNVTVANKVYQGVLDTQGRFSVDVPSQALATSANKTVEVSVDLTDAAGNAATVQAQTTYRVNIDTEAKYLYHLAANLDGNGGVKDTAGKTGSNDAYKTSDFNDYIYVGYKGVDASGKLIVSSNDGDFERDLSDGNVVWTLDTKAGNDLVQIREDQNAYTVAKLGAGDDRYYVGGKLDADFFAAQKDNNARSYVLTADGNDTVIIGGNAQGQVTGWGVDGGRIFTGSGSDNVTVYGHVDDGAVIDLGTGSTQYANMHTDAASQDDSTAINTLYITRDLGNTSTTGFGYVLGGKGQEQVKIDGNIRGASQISLGDNDDSVTLNNMYQQSVINLGTGNNTVAVNTLYDQAAIAAIGNGQNSIAVAGDVDGKSTITTGSGNDTLSIGDDVEDYATITLGEGQNTITVRDNIEDSARLFTGTGDDQLTVGGGLYNLASVSLGDGNNRVDIKGVYHEANLITGAGADQVKIDHLSAYSNHVAVSTGAGDDIITYTGTTMSGIIDSGAGKDTLVLNHTADSLPVTSSINVTNASSSNLRGIELVKLEGNNALDIRYTDLVADTSRNGALLVQGNSASKVDLGSTNWNSDTAAQASLKDTTGGSWTKTGSQSIDGISYDIYHHSSAGASLQQDVYIQQGLTII